MTTKKTRKPTTQPKRKTGSLALGTCSASVRELRAIAKKMKPGVLSVSHVLPRAYCVAKPAAYCAVFAVPTCDREPQVRDDPWATVQNESAKDVKHGDWCALAYISTRDGSGSMHVLPNNQGLPRSDSDVGSSALFANHMQTALVFAARYTHNRQTAGTLAVVCALESCWHQLTAQTRAQILKESNEATCNRDDWERLRAFAANVQSEPRGGHTL